jgi:RNA polymerase sigma-70 factor (ECF subfamily)
VDEGSKDRLFQEIVAANRRRIMAIARSYARGDEHRDLCQEILLQIWKGLDGFEGRSAVSTWVYRVALNTAITFLRKNGLRARTTGEIEAGSRNEPASPPAPGSEVLILEEFLGSLGKVDRAVFLLYLEDLSYHEMSEITGLSEGHIGVRVSRLKKAFVRRYCEG